jgi:hypothetical protein
VLFQTLHLVWVSWSEDSLVVLCTHSSAGIPERQISYQASKHKISDFENSMWNTCWSLTLREECRLRVFENKVLRRIFGPKRDEVTGEWWRLHNKELYALYSSPNIIRVIKPRRLRWAGHVARMGERRSAYRALVGKPEARRPLWRLRHRWEDNIKMDLQEVGWGGMDWMNLAQDRDRWRALLNAVMNLQVP